MKMIKPKKQSHSKVENHLSKSEKRWFAIYTKYKAEKFVEKQLTKKGIHAYLPLIHKSKRYSRKIKHYQVPLINCYAFVCIDSTEYVPVLETEHVLSFIKQGKNLISIPQREIDLLKRIVNSENEAFAEPLYFSQGMEVEIIKGQLTGLKGYLIDQKNKNEFVVELHSLGIQLKIEINPAYLRPTSKVA